MKFWIAILSLFLVACQTSPSLYQFTGNAMTMPYRILIGHPLSSSEQTHIEAAILSVFKEVNKTYNKWNPDSELSQLNRLPANVQVALSPSLNQFLQKTDELVKISKGKFDPTVETVQTLWKTYLMQGTTPPIEEILILQKRMGWDKIHLERGRFWKEYGETQLDLGGIAKGLGVDLLVEKLNALGYLNVYVEWGGEIRVSGQHPENRPWRIYIADSKSTELSKAFAILELHQQAIATSGDYLQKWSIQEDQKTTTYFHIFDPATGAPLISQERTLTSASVRAPTCAYADGLATTAMLFPDLESAQKWAQELELKNSDLHFWLFGTDGSSYITNQTSSTVLQK